MKTLLYYLMQMIITSGILYAYYHFALRNKRFHHYNRFYLLAATGISMVVPFLNIPVYFTQAETSSSFVLQTLTAISPGTVEEPVRTATSYQQPTPFFSWQNVLYLLYVLVAAIVLLRIIISLINIRRIARNNPAEKIGNILFINTAEPSTPFSFFRWLFWNRRIELRSEKGEQIFKHELFHIQQKHSRDIMYLEILSVLFWINPFLLLIKKEVKAIHEFLADQFAVNENKKWEYAELLLMQVLKTNQRLVNPFFHNQIKRRVAMITTSKKPGHQYLRKLMVLPIAAFIIILFAFSYKKADKQNKQNEISVSLNLSSPDTVGKKYPDTILWIKGTWLPPKKSPSPGQLATWSDPKKYELWLDGKMADNAVLKKYIPSDFGLYTVSQKGRLVYLMTKRYYDDIYKATSSLADPKYLIRYKENPSSRVKDLQFLQDRIVVRKRSGNPGLLHDVELKNVTVSFYGDMPESNDSHHLIFIDGKEYPGLSSIADADQVIKFENISIINVYNGNYAVSKYGDKGKNGVIEIFTQKNRNIKPSFTDTVPVTNKDIMLHNKVEIEPTFDGGVEKWKEYLKRNLKATIPLEKGAPEGVYTVMVQFVVSKEGNISEVQAFTTHGYGMEEEAIRVIRLGPDWIPAVDRKKRVTASRIQYITFYIPHEGEKLKLNTNKNVKAETNDYSNPSNWDYNDPEFKEWKQQTKKEIVAIARKEGAAAYYYKHRTYVFANIDETKPANANTYFEADGVVRQFVLNGRLIHSIDEINAHYLRKDIRSINLLFPDKAKEKYNITGAILEIETFSSPIARR